MQIKEHDKVFMFRKHLLELSFLFLQGPYLQTDNFDLIVYMYIRIK